jgi:hypothetical protein
MSIMDEDKRVTEGRVGCAEYGMHYSPANEKVVERARSLPDEDWDTLPIQQLPNGTPLEANEEMLKKEPIEKVVSGAEPFREGYVTKLWRAEDGKLHIADGHHRVAMYSVLGRDMPVRILDEAAYNRLTERKGPPR